MPVRGFKRHSTRTKGPDRDRLGATDVLSNRVAGAPVIPRARIPASLLLPYKPMPPSWPNSLLEWVTFDYLTRVKHFTIFVDFQFQAAVPAPGLNGKGFTRADFLVLPGGKAGLPDGFYPRGLILNPISPFTHPSRAKDTIERLILGNNGFLEIFLDDVPLLATPRFVIEAGLRGRDLSSRGAG